MDRIFDRARKAPVPIDTMPEHIGAVGFELPAETPEDEARDALARVDAFVAKVKSHVDETLQRFVHIDAIDFAILQQRVVCKRSAREIGDMPFFPGRNAVITRCYDLAAVFPVWKDLLLQGFEKEENPHAKKVKVPNGKHPGPHAPRGARAPAGVGQD